MNNLRKSHGLVLFLLVPLTVAAAGDGLTPRLFVKIDQLARELTLDGMERRLEALRSGASEQRLRRLQRQTRHAIAQLYQYWGITPSAHATYGGEHAAKIERWLERHPAWQENYRGLEARFESLLSQLERMN